MAILLNLVKSSTHGYKCIDPYKKCCNPGQLQKKLFSDKFHLQLCPTNRVEINCNPGERFHGRRV